MGCAKDVVLEFVRCINDKDLDRLAAKMTEDHLFIDAGDARHEGRAFMADAWKTYLSWFPNYGITVERVFERGDVVGLFGRARGTYAVGGQLLAENSWDVPAAWLAVVEGGRVKHWQVYAENQPAVEIMKRCGAPR